MAERRSNESKKNMDNVLEMTAAAAMVVNDDDSGADSGGGGGTGTDGGENFEWTARTIAVSIMLFVAAGFAEIGGGWLVWMAVRGYNVATTATTKANETTEEGLEDTGGISTESTSTSITTTLKKPWWWAVLGSFVLILYGFIPCFQPTDSFGRIYAAYGGFFIVLAFLFGWMVDGDRPDIGDGVGCAISLAGVFVIMFWPR
jgi:small multidrug resistance family-3 protein